LCEYRKIEVLVIVVVCLKNWVLWLGGIALVALLALNFSTSQKAKVDVLAQCLTANGAKIYGAYWCPHCLDQKKEFGDSWKYVTYVECSLPDNAGETQACIDAGIRGYPTWEFADGRRVSGKLSFEQLASYSNCKW
jgi:hypothetical protein